MGDYVTITDVDARIAHPGGFGASSIPTSTQIELWIVEGENLTTRTLIAIGGSGTYTGAAATIVRSWVMDYVEGHTRKSYSLGSVDMPDSDANGSSLLDRFHARLDDMSRQPTHYLALLGDGDALESGGSRLRSYVTHNADNKSVSNGDFAPTFTRSETF